MLLIRDNNNTKLNDIISLYIDAYKMTEWTAVEQEMKQNKK